VHRSRGINLSGSDISGEPEMGTIEAPEENNEAKVTKKRSTKTLSFMLKVGKKIALNPNTYASMVGLVWSLISYR
jgi:auxin efflux carrier family protein